jgi:polyisoprenoid-binding protein YceI
MAVTAIRSIEPGTYRFGPENAVLSVRTGRVGAAAKAGHDLLIHVTVWEATLVVGDDHAPVAIELQADPGSFQVREGTGGMQKLDQDDIANIHETIATEVLKDRAIDFRSSAVAAADDGSGLEVQGELTLAGEMRPVALHLSIAEGERLLGKLVIKQTEWGMKPYSTLFGALKVADEVEVAVDATLPVRAA